MFECTFNGTKHSEKRRQVMKNQDIRIGVWGFGSHGRAHAKLFKHVDGLKLVSICDDKPETARLCRYYGKDIKFFTDPSAFLASVDAVLVATPDKHHISNLFDAVQAGKHVFMEKPLAITNQEILELSNLMTIAEQKGLVVTSCHPRRYDPPFVWLKESLPRFEVKMGDVLSFDFDFSYHQPSEPWKAHRSLMLDHLGHEFDLATFLFGLVSVRMQLQHDAYDRYAVSGMRDDGIALSFSGTRMLDSRKFFEWATIRFRRGELRLDCKTGWATIYDHDTGEKWSERCGITKYDTRNRLVVENFVATINGTVTNYLSRNDLYYNNFVGVILLEKYDVRCEI